MNKNYYEILGVQKTATADQIKQAYRSIALTNHPDKNPDNPEAEQLFKTASEAYQILSDPEKKQKYDTMGYSPYDDSSFDFGHFNLGDIFKDLFGEMFGGFNFNFQGGPRPSQPSKNAVMYNISADLKTLFLGKTIDIPSVNVRVSCHDCNGLGSTSNQKSYASCDACQGTGRQTITYQNGPFTSQQIIPCTKCSQSGKILLNPCKGCNGTGYTTVQKELQLHIPPRTSPSTQLNLLQDNFNSIVANIQYLSGVDGYELSPYLDITKQINIGVVQAIKGGSINLVHLDDSVIKVVIPEGTQDGAEIIIQGQGLEVRGSLTSLIVIVNVTIPKYSQLNSKDKKAFDKLGGLDGLEQN